MIELAVLMLDALPVVFVPLILVTINVAWMYIIASK